MKQTLAPKNDGFTLIEFIAVLTILGILSVIIAERWTLRDNELIGQIGVVKSHLRYAQSRAMSSTSKDSSSYWYVHFGTSPDRYTLYYKKDGGDVLQYFPGEADSSIALASGISLTAALAAAPYVIFDYLGRSYLSTSNTPGTQLAAATTIITSSVGDIEIKPETGFIP